ncbi:MAG: serine/threonine protein kinase [Myxococcales bacterium]|nr:serine/threonine protein kinase [Myxococcales bacterium]
MTSKATETCLDDHEIAALVGGTMSTAERTAATGHLDSCDACRDLIAEAALARPTVDAKGRSSERGRAKSGPVATPSPAPEGDVDEGRYRDREEIARGGMGRVLEATDSVLGRRVAVKEVLSTSPEALRRFAREIRITARLEHPSIVPVYDTGTSPDGSPFYVMRKVSGQPLEELVGDAGTLEQRLALLPHLVAAANAVAHAHRRGVVHRDIKPTNILVGDLGETVVIDWGLAKVLDDPEDEIASAAEELDAGDSLRTRAGTVFGTPGFMSPEQLAGQPVDERCDVYALGATLYHLLARQPPHARSSGTEMMSAALSGPPRPLSELVTGVPPELSTIVEKALAYDDRVRYRNAGALAEDLQRFISGQLVASHHYSRRERLLRFVRAHRVAVGSVVLTVAAISIVGAISINGVVDARDRTDAALHVALSEKQAAEEARARANERADELTLAQARMLVDSNPTAAVAMIKPLASSSTHWLSVRDIGAAARSAGAAWGLEAPLIVTSLEVSPDGTTALSCGVEGTVRLYDLAAKSTREVAKAGEHAHATFAGDTRIITYLGSTITALDLATSTSHELEWKSLVTDVVANPTSVFWLDPDEAVWRTDAALAAPHPIAMGKANHLSLSPDGHWLAAYGRDHLYLVDLATEKVHEIGTGPTTDVGWDPAGHGLAAAIGGLVHDVRLAPDPVVTQSFPTRSPFGVARFKDQLFYYAFNPSGVMVRTDGGALYRAAGVSMLPLLVAREDVVVSVDDTAGGILVLSADRDLRIQPPIRGLYRYAASPHGHFVVGAGEGRLLIWDLDVLLPRRIPVPYMHGFTLVGRDEAIVKSANEPWVWIDLATGKSSPIPAQTPWVPVLAGTDPDRVLVVTDGQAAVLERGNPAPILIEGQVTHALMIPKHRLLLVMPNGDILSSDLHGKDRVLLGSHAAKPVFSRWLESWVVVQFSDGFVWRRDLETNVSSTLELGTTHLASSPRRIDPLEIPMQLAADGRVFATRGNEVVCWKLDGQLVHHATLPRTPMMLSGIGNDLALALTDDRAAYLLDFAHADKVVSVLPAGAGTQIRVSTNTQLALVPGTPGMMDVIDVVTGIRWPLGARRQADTAAMSSDGSHIVQMIGQEQLGIWTLQLPTKAEDLGAWLYGITNATAELGPSSVTWAK